MLSIESLKEAGAEVDSGLERCLGNEAFYLKLVNMVLDDEGFKKLRTAVEAGDLKQGFEHAHALKGVLANVALSNILEPVLVITEALRAGEERDYSELLDQIDGELAKLLALR